jgi:nucleoside-diphosphate-sugar epimerase
LNTNNKITIGITGATGVLGKILKEKLEALSYHVTTFDDDIRNSQAVETWIQSNNMQAVFHLAAMVPVTLVNKNPLDAYAVNAGGTIHLLNAIKNLQHKPWLFYASTCHVYKSKTAPIAETDEIEPINIYGQTKYAGENICTAYQQQTLAPVCIGRIFSFFHASQKEPFLYPSIRARIEKHDPSQPFVLEGAENVRDFLNAEAIVDILIKLMEKRNADTVNIGSGNSITIKDFVQQAFPSLTNISYQQHVPNFLVADVKKLTSILNA